MSSEQTIRRGVRNARYAAIPNHVFEDERLSMEARWLLGYLLSKPDNWTVVIGDITRRGNCGRDKARKMIAELVELGYAEREQVRDDGKFGASVLVIYDEPLSMQAAETKAESESVAFLPQTDLPATAKPSPDSPSPVKSALSNNSDSANTDDYQEREGAGAEDQAEDLRQIEKQFDGLMIGRHGNPWPKVLKSSRKWALERFLELTPEERKLAEERRDAYLAACPKIKSGDDKGKPDCVALGVYIRDKMFNYVEAISPRDVRKQAKSKVPPFGPAWSGLRFVLLARGPIALPPPETDPRDATRQTFQTLQRANPARALAYLERKGVTIGEHGQPVFPPDFLEAEERRRVMAEGFPEVNRLHEAASHRATIETEADISRFSALCEPVPVGSEMWWEWADEHARRGWPWVPDPEQMRIVYFPKGGPRGLQEFINAATAANSEAAE